MEKNGRYSDAVSAYEASLLQTRDSARRSQIYFRMGECLVRLERIPEAFNAFEHAVELDPKNSAARLRMGEFFLSAGAPDRAREQAEFVLQGGAANSEAVALLGAALEGSGRREQAKHAYEKALAMDPARVSVAVALADLYNRDDKTAEAEQVLEDSARANPKNATPLLALGRLHEQEGNVDAAEHAYRAAVQAEDTPESNLRLAQFLQRISRIAEAEQVLRRVDAKRPAEPTALPDFQLLSGRPGNALDSYSAALSSHLLHQKKQTAAERDERSRVATRLVEADLEVASHKTGDARATAIGRARTDFNSYQRSLDAATDAILQAEIALTEADLPAATNFASTAVSLAPKSASALYVLGLVRDRCADPAGARTQWEAALDVDSHFVPAHLALAEQGLATGDLSGAVTHVMTAVRDEPGNFHGLTLFARVLNAQHRYASATVIARRAQVLDTTSPEPHLILGKIAQADGRVGEALLHYEQAVLLDPHSREAMDGLTEVYRTGKITRPMLAKMEAVATASPASPTLLEIAGRLYAEHGWYAEAKRCLETALQLDPQRTTSAAALAQVFAQTGDLRAAAESASRTGGNSAALLAGMKAQDNHDINSAIQNYERAVRGGEKSGIAANNLAWLYAEQGRNLDRALMLAQAAESLSPQDPAVLDTLGFVRLRMRSYSDAVKTLEAARRVAVNKSADAQLLAQIGQHLAEAYRRAGTTGAATPRSGD